MREMMDTLRKSFFITGAITTMAYLSIAAIGVTPAQYRMVHAKYIVCKSFSESKTIRQIVNPRNAPETADSYFRTITLKKGQAGISNEALLANLLHGFFTSRAFAPEAVALRLLRLDLGEFSGMCLCRSLCCCAL